MTLNPNGTLYALTAWTSNATIGTAYVPANGTLYVQTLLSYSPPGINLWACLESLKVTR
jgi:hypothetical protein